MFSIRHAPEHIGKKFLTVDVRSSLSPAFRTYIPADADEAALCRELQRRMQDAIRDVFGEVDFPLEPAPTVEPLHCKLARPFEEEKAESDALLESLRESHIASHEARVAELKANPDNGKDGWWSVDGIRHSAVVKATSALEAIEKAERHVGDWESPTVQFIGETLPEVFSC
jgi:hypothetical protein